MRKGILCGALVLICAGCITTGRVPRAVSVEQIRKLDGQLTAAERVWVESIDDPWTEPDMRRHYHSMQDLCRECAGGREGFETIEEKQLCDRVRDPYDIYFNNLYVRVNNLEKQIEIKERLEAGESGTVAYEYRQRPSKENLARLHRIFDQVHHYYVGWPYTWTRYINKYPFQKARDEHFRKAFLDRDREYLQLVSQAGSDPQDLIQARRRAEFEFGRLKEEYAINDLPHAGEVNAFYRARSLDEYHRFGEEEKALDEKRKREGRKKEVAIFVHGLSESRASWGKFPELLSREDVVNGDIKDRYFKAYVFSYATVEDSKSVEGFKKELDGFIRDILRDEHVEKVHLIGHSFGAVLCLKYLIYQNDATLEGVNRENPSAVAEALVKGYGEEKIHQTVESFMSIAGSLSGSEIANIAGDQFIPREQLFRRNLPIFRGGVPGYGDIQVRENQLGSAVNLSSFRRLDIECILSPLDLLKFLPDDARSTAEGATDELRSGNISTLCVVGDPVKLRSFLHKEGYLKARKFLKFGMDGLFKALNSFKREEDDGLVKSYSANINHTYLLASGEDIGYRGASVRYTNYEHFSSCNVGSREHLVYRYVVSFLTGRLLPQMQKGRYHIDLFGMMLRVFPDAVNPQENPDAYFMPEERVVYLKDTKLVLPALTIEMVAPGKDAEGVASRNSLLGQTQWNRLTGVCLYEGRVKDASRPASVSVRLRAEGYQDTLLTVPVRAGEVSYAVNVKLGKAAR
ncbi:MAG: alpha/beta hydrolase [Candidatus Aureabacteria bacterium]|nr:alpha/beta hydrolase [Candidatus Auribacterota bacterium]